jgi:hypothetical protein
MLRSIDFLVVDRQPVTVSPDHESAGCASQNVAHGETACAADEGYGYCRSKP